MIGRRILTGTACFIRTHQRPTTIAQNANAWHDIYLVCSWPCGNGHGDPASKTGDRGGHSVTTHVGGRRRARPKRLTAGKAKEEEEEEEATVKELLKIVADITVHGKTIACLNPYCQEWGGGGGVDRGERDGVRAGREYTKLLGVGLYGARIEPSPFVSRYSWCYLKNCSGFWCSYAVVAL